MVLHLNDTTFQNVTISRRGCEMGCTMSEQQFSLILRCAELESSRTKVNGTEIKIRSFSRYGINIESHPLDQFLQARLRHLGDLCPLY